MDRASREKFAGTDPVARTLVLKERTAHRPDWSGLRVDMHLQADSVQSAGHKRPVQNRALRLHPACQPARNGYRLRLGWKLLSCVHQPCERPAQESTGRTGGMAGTERSGPVASWSTGWHGSMLSCIRCQIIRLQPSEWQSRPGTGNNDKGTGPCNRKNRLGRK